MWTESKRATDKDDSEWSEHYCDKESDCSKTQLFARLKMLLFVCLEWSQADYKGDLYTSPITATIKWHTTFRAKFFTLQVASYVKEAGVQSQLPWLLAREQGYYELKKKHFRVLQDGSFSHWTARN